MNRTVRVHPWGLLPYETVYGMQQQIHGEVVAGKTPPTILYGEHPPVLTLGKHASSDDLLVDRASLEKERISLVQTDRGGKITAHGPGQLVLYPLLPLPQLGFSVRTYICRLEEAVIQTLQAFQIHGARHREYPGVWVNGAKIAAVGVRVKNRVTMHGISLNVNNSLGLFHKVVPCGIRGGAVCSMASVSMSHMDLAQVKNRLLEILLPQLGLMAEVEGEAPLDDKF